MRAPRLDSLTGLRWWAAAAVFIHHLAILVPYPPVLARVTVLGVHGVTFFFVLSGFVLTWSSGRAVPGASVPDARTFWWRRFARIYPAHLVALLLAVPVFTSLFVAEGSGWWVDPFSLGILALSVVLLQGWSRDPMVLFSGNPAAWTLSCEAFFYALHPAADRALARTSRRGALAVALGVVVVAVAVRVLIGSGTAAGGAVGGWPWPVLRVTEFFLGMALARAVALGWRPRLRPGLVAGVLGVVVTWLALGRELLDDLGGESSFALTVHDAVLPGMQEVMTVGLGLLVAAVAVRELERGPKRLGAPWLVRLGEWSYAFYLVHATILYALLALFGRQHGAVGVVVGVGALAASIGAAWLLHVAVERPAERRLRSAWDSRRAARARRAAPVDLPA
ncbi:acyltransferase family protein [Sanguibacter sp. A247]|uniref:acyltransferase family protein n=1 Tax=unclassified Sanguibacter TaxID=2645534 RepID=UPI003FD7299F